ncbi:hypothetical protein [Sporosarcina sp. FSL K6-2383]
MAASKKIWSKLYEIVFFTVCGLLLLLFGFGFIIMLLFTIDYFAS